MEEKSASALAPLIEVMPVTSRLYGFPDEYFGRSEAFLEGCGDAMGRGTVIGTCETRAFFSREARKK